MKFVPLSLLLALVVLASSASSAGASSSRRSETAGSFCGVARGVARDIVKSTSLSNGRGTRANIKTTYLKIAAAEPALLASAPGPIKSDLRPVFAFVNLVIVDFKKVNWNPRRLTPYLPTLIPRAQKVQKPLHTLEVYFKTICKINA